MEKPAQTTRAVELSPMEQGTLQMLQRAARLISGERREEVAGGTLVKFTLGYAIQVLIGHSVLPGSRGEAPRVMFENANLARECLMRLVEADRLGYNRNVEQVTIFVPVQDLADSPDSQYSSIVQVDNLTMKAKHVILAIYAIEQQGKRYAQLRTLAMAVYWHLRSGSRKGEKWPKSILGVQAILSNLVKHGILLSHTSHTAEDNQGSWFTASARTVLKDVNYELL